MIVPYSLACSLAVSVNFSIKQIPMQYDSIQDQELLDDKIGIIRPYLRDYAKNAARKSLCDGDGDASATAASAGATNVKDMEKATKAGLDQGIIVYAMKHMK